MTDMNFSINNNASAQSILSNLSYVEQQTNNSYQQLSTGNRVNSAADNPASYSISQQMTSQINGLNQATQNAQNGISMIQTATGAMNQVEQVLQTMGTLATEAANSGNTFSDRANLQLEMNALAQQINSTTNQTQYNGINLLTGQYGSANTTLTLQVGADQGQVLGFNIGATDVSSLGVQGNLISAATDTAVAGTGSNSAITPASPAVGIAASVSAASSSLLQGGMTLQLVFTANVATGTSGTGGTGGNPTSGTLQLETSNGTAIGNAIQLGYDSTNKFTYNGQAVAGSTITIGDTATGATLSLTMSDLTTLFTAATGNAAGTYTQADTINLTASTAPTSASKSTGWQAATNVFGINIMTQAGAQSAISAIQGAINNLSSSQAQLGAVQDRLNYTVSNLQNSSQNLQNAQSTITNTNMAQAYTQFSQQQILSQVGIAMLSQAQQQPGMILKLLQ